MRARVVCTNIQVDTRTTIESQLLAMANIETMKAAIHELLEPGIEQMQALKVLEEAASNHDAGPFISPINEDAMNAIKDFDAKEEAVDTEAEQTLAQ